MADLFILILRGIILSCLFIIPISTEYIAQFTLPDNNEAQVSPLGNIISQLQSPFPSGIYQIITRKCSYSKFNQYFRITDAGDLLLSRGLDRDDINNVCGPLLCCEKSKCEIILDIIVTLRRTNQRFPVKVLIDIIDENDNSPKFMEDSFVISILENEKVHNRYSLPSAFDLDSSKYKIKDYELSGIGKTNFSLKIYNNLPFIIPTKSFDYEDISQRKFEMFLLAEDYGGKKGTLNLRINILDANDNAPICLDTNKNISVIENTTYTESIFTFRATDLDSGNNGKISYTFSSTTVPIIKDTFRLDKETGGLFLSKKLDFELYSEQSYKITIEASDNGLPQLNDFCSIEIHVTDINDNSPVIDIIQIQPVLENVLIKEPVIKFYVRDDDTTDTEVTCRAEESSTGLKLHQEEKFYYFIYASGIYDHEKENKLTILIVCQDSGKIPRQSKQLLTIPIKDKNDNTPRFTELLYKKYISENYALHKTFINVKASDKDSDEFGEIKYELGWENKNLFTIDKKSGDVSLIKYLDREKKDSFNITVIAVDGGGLKGSANILLQVLDVNDNAPKIVSGTVMNISENVAHGTVVGYFIVKDVDLDENRNVEWKHELIGNSSILLEVDNFTIITAGDIDREMDESLYVLITMMDKGSPQLTSSATITVSIIDQNDNIPVVTYPNAGSIIEENDGMTIPTNTPRYSQVINIKSYDPDIGINGQVLYHMLPTNGSKYFIINQTDGSVLTNWAYDTISFTPTHPKEGLYKISFAVYNQVKSTKNSSASSTNYFFIRVVPYRHFVNNEIFQQQHKRPFFNNIVLLILIGGFTISLSAALIAAIIWAKSKYSSESNSLEQVQNNDGKFMMMMMTGEQQNTNNTYVYDPYSSLMMDHDRTIDSGYPLSHSRSSTFNARRIGRDHPLNNFDNKTMPRNIIQPDMTRYCGSDVYNQSNSLSTTDLANSTSTTGRQPKLTNEPFIHMKRRLPEFSKSFYRHFEHDSRCHSPILQSISRQQSLEHQYGSISPRAASICDPTPDIATTSNWIPRVSAPTDDSSNSYTIC